MQKSEANIDSLKDYYASHRAPAIINHKLKIGRVFAAYKDNLIIIDGEFKKEHEYLIQVKSRRMEIAKSNLISQKVL